MNKKLILKEMVNSPYIKQLLNLDFPQSVVTKLIVEELLKELEAPSKERLIQLILNEFLDLDENSKEAITIFLKTGDQDQLRIFGDSSVFEISEYDLEVIQKLYDIINADARAKEVFSDQLTIIKDTLKIGRDLEPVDINWSYDDDGDKEIANSYLNDLNNDTLKNFDGNNEDYSPNDVEKTRALKQDLQTHLDGDGPIHPKASDAVSSLDDLLSRVDVELARSAETGETPAGEPAGEPSGEPAGEPAGEPSGEPAEETPSEDSDEAEFRQNKEEYQESLNNFLDKIYEVDTAADEEKEVKEFYEKLLELYNKLKIEERADTRLGSRREPIPESLLRENIDKASIKFRLGKILRRYKEIKKLLKEFLEVAASGKYKRRRVLKEFVQQVTAFGNEIQEAVNILPTDEEMATGATDLLEESEEGTREVADIFNGFVTELRNTMDMEFENPDALLDTLQRYINKMKTEILPLFIGIKPFLSGGAYRDRNEVLDYSEEFNDLYKSTLVPAVGDLRTFLFSDSESEDITTAIRAYKSALISFRAGTLNLFGIDPEGEIVEPSTTPVARGGGEDRAVPMTPDLGDLVDIVFDEPGDTDTGTDDASSPEISDAGIEDVDSGEALSALLTDANYEEEIDEFQPFLLDFINFLNESSDPVAESIKKQVLKIIKENGANFLIIEEDDDEFEKKLESVFTRFLSFKGFEKTVHSDKLKVLKDMYRVDPEKFKSLFNIDKKHNEPINFEEFVLEKLNEDKDFNDLLNFAQQSEGSKTYSSKDIDKIEQRYESLQPDRFLKDYYNAYFESLTDEQQLAFDKDKAMKEILLITLKYVKQQYPDLEEDMTKQLKVKIKIAQEVSEVIKNNLSRFQGKGPFEQVVRNEIKDLLEPVTKKIRKNYQSVYQRYFVNRLIMFTLGLGVAAATGGMSAAMLGMVFPSLSAGFLGLSPMAMQGIVTGVVGSGVGGLASLVLSGIRDYIIGDKNEEQLKKVLSTKGIYGILNTLADQIKKDTDPKYVEDIIKFHKKALEYASSLNFIPNPPEDEEGLDVDLFEEVLHKWIRINVSGPVQRFQNVVNDEFGYEMDAAQLLKFVLDLAEPDNMKQLENNIQKLKQIKTGDKEKPKEETGNLPKKGDKYRYVGEPKDDDVIVYKKGEIYKINDITGEHTDDPLVYFEPPRGRTLYPTTKLSNLKDAEEWQKVEEQDDVQEQIQRKLEVIIERFINQRKQQWRKRTM